MNKVLAASLVFAASTAFADVTVDVHRVSANGVGDVIGRITLADSKHGLVLTPQLNQLPEGLRGIHIHQKGSCEPATTNGKPTAAGAAGDHFDPNGSKRHGTPWEDNGHLGDMPPLYVDAQGRATQPFVAPRLTLKQVLGKAIVVHTGGDNFSDQPAPSGGGGDRIACGVIPQAGG